MSTSDTIEFDDIVRAALGNIGAASPHPSSWPLTAPASSASSVIDPRWFAAAAAGVVAVAGVGAVALLGGRDADAPGGGSSPASTTPLDDPATSESEVSIRQASAPGPTPTTVVADTEPVTCGTELPVDVTVAGAGEMTPGAAPGQRPPAAGQLVGYWNGDVGTVEIRWPADPKVLYDLAGTWADSDAGLPGEPYVQVGGTGQSVELSRETLTGPGDAPSVDTLSSAPETAPDVVVSRRPGGEGDAAVPCDVVQVSIGAPDGFRWIHGLFWPDLMGELSRGRGDLGPLIVATGDPVAAPVLDDVTPCDTAVGPVGGTLVGTSWAATPAEALWAYLDSGSSNFQVLMDSGYVEYAETADRYVYTYSPDYDASMMATLIVVERDGERGWHVTAQYNSGC